MESKSNSEESNCAAERRSVIPRVRPRESAVSSVNIMVKGVLLIFLAMSGNFLAELLGCQTQKLLSENMWAKHAVLLFSIYFAMGLVQDLNPYRNIAETILIWLLFLLFTKTTTLFSVLIFLALIIFYIFQNFTNYYEKEGLISDKLVKYLIKIRQVLLINIIMLIIIGFVLYSRKQFLEHRDNFSILQLIFGTLKCDYQSVQNL